MGFNKDPEARCVVYQYGGKHPTENEDEAINQLAKANRFRNRLVELELQRREEYHAAFSGYGDLAEPSNQLETLNEQLTAAVAELKAWRQLNGTRSQHPTLTPQIVSLRAQARQLRTQIKSIKEAAKGDPTVQAAIEKANQQHRDQTKAAYGAVRESNPEAEDARDRHGLFWGTALLVQRAATQFQKGPPPRYKRFDGTGTIGVQLQNGMSVEDLFTPGGSVWIDPVPPEAWDPQTPRGQRRKLARTMLHMRIGGKPQAWVILKLPVTVHRPLPAGKLIKWVTVTRRKYGSQARWYVNVTTDIRSGGTLHDDVAAAGFVGVDLGFRLFKPAESSSGKRSLRVAVWAGDDGETGELRLDARFMSYISKADGLRSIRDKRLDQIRAALLPLCDEAGTPEWWKDDTQHMAKWRSPRKLYHLLHKWKDNRWDGDKTLFDLLVKWVVQDRHLHVWEANNRRKVAARRLDMYRNLAASLRRKYAVIGIEDIDWRIWSKLALPEEEETKSKKFRVQKKHAAVGLLAETLSNCGAQVVRLDPAYTTKRCNACGKITEFDADRHLRHTCEHCHAEWDQDYNAAKNLQDMASGNAVTQTA